jgi:hypothetical protein
MRTSLSCPQGHSWEAERTDDCETPRCPVFGSAAAPPTVAGAFATVLPTPAGLETEPPAAEVARRRGGAAAG